jgi:hypothetical protein
MKQFAPFLLLLWPLWAFTQDDDTTFQTARTRNLQEVLIRAEEPAWIREKLKLFIKKREGNYQQEPCFSEYDFFFQDTGSDLQRGSQRTVTDSLTAYRFQSQGLLLSPSMAQMKQDSVFRVAPEQNTVFGTDTVCESQPDSAYVRWDYLNEMLYQNLIQSLDKHFLSQHRFAVNWDFQHPNPNVVQLVFWSTKYQLDRGYLNLDTVRCMVLEAERHSGLDCVKHEFCNSFALWALNRFIKLQLKDWTILLRAAYTEEGQPHEFQCQSQRHFASWSDVKKKRREWMDNKTTCRASLLLRPTSRKAQYPDLIDIYPPKSIEILNSKSRRYLMKERLRNIPRQYILLEE